MAEVRQISKAIPVTVLALAIVVTGLLVAAIASRNQTSPDNSQAKAETELPILTPADPPEPSPQPTFKPKPEPVATALKPISSKRPDALPPVPDFLKEQTERRKVLEKQRRDAEEEQQKRLAKALSSDTEIMLSADYIQTEAGQRPPEPSGTDLYNQIINQRDRELQETARFGGSGAGSPASAQSKQNYLDNNDTEVGYLDNARTPRRSVYELKAGRLLNATLLTGVNTVLPGNITALVNTPVLDSVTGSEILIPVGTLLFGSYDSETALGQNRLLIGFHRIEFPDGSTLQLGTMQAVDALGQTGAKGRGSNRFLQALAGATGLGLVSAAVQLTQPSGGGTANDARQTLAAELGRQWSNLSIELINKVLSIQPTLTLKPGFHLHVMITKDIILPPYGPLAATEPG